MCLIFVALDAHPRYRLIVAANRDEFHSRPTAPLAPWSREDGGETEIVAGRDLVGGHMDGGDPGWSILCPYELSRYSSERAGPALAGGGGWSVAFSTLNRRPRRMCNPCASTVGSTTDLASWSTME